MRSKLPHPRHFSHGGQLYELSFGTIADYFADCEDPPDAEKTAGMVWYLWPLDADDERLDVLAYDIAETKVQAMQQALSWLDARAATDEGSK